MKSYIDHINERARADGGASIVTKHTGIKEVTDIHPSPGEFSPDEVNTDPVLRFFHYSHLPEMLRAASAPFCQLARHIVDTTPRNAERTVALRKLLEAKDAAVRAMLP
jgi:hypothetical protein